MTDSEITLLISQLGRPHASGGLVVERAAIQAAGTDYRAVIDWILDHDGEPEQAVSRTRSGGGLHGSRMHSGAATVSRPAARFVVPAAAFH